VTAGSTDLDVANDRVLVNVKRLAGTVSSVSLQNMNDQSIYQQSIDDQKYSL